MRRAPRKARALAPFYAGLRAEILAAWASKPGFAYDRVIYSVHYPYTDEDLDRVLTWCGKPDDRARLPPVGALNDMLEGHTYPELSGMAPTGVSTHGWSAILHFCDPSYAVYTDETALALAELGFDVAGADGAPDYGRFLAAVDTLKAEAPATAIPETNWYLARNIGVGLESWWRSRGAATSGGP